MRIDLQYIKELLEIVLEHNEPDFKIDLPKINHFWKNESDQIVEEKLNILIFHMEILGDQGLIESSTSLDTLGFRRISGGGFTVSIVPLRLTAKGHQFAVDLEKPGVVDTVKNQFKEAGPKEAVDLVLKLGRRYMDKKLDALMD